MLKNYIIIVIRSFKRNKFYSSLNVMGLSVGIATAILSFLYVANELSYDRFHANTDRIYRIAVDALSGTTVIKQTATPAAMPAALYNEFSEIEAVCRINGGNSSTKVEYNGNTFIEPDVFLTDTTFFKIFTGEFLAGETGPRNLNPNRAIITEKLAGKYFGNRNPIGQILVLDDEYHIEVAAVVREFPANSHFHFDMLVSLLSFEGFYNNPNWFANNFRTYIMLQKNQNYKNLEAKLPAFVDKYLFDGKYKERAIDGNKWELYLQPLTDIHLHSHLSGELEANGNAVYIYIFGAVAVFILLIACINFVNLATAKAGTRAKEIAIRKVAGSRKNELIRQFLSESLLLSAFSLIIALLLVETAIVYLPAWLDVHIPVPTALKINLIPGLTGLVLITGLLSGIYPALVLSSFKPVSVLKNQILKGAKHSWLRTILVIFQFSISIVLIIGAFVISKQLNFIQNEQLGFDKEQIVVVHNANLIEKDINTLQHELKQLPGIQSVSVSNRLPGIQFSNIGFRAEGFDGGYTLNLCLVDPEFQDVLKFEMAQGRFFSKEFSTDTMAVVLNEAAVKLLGWEEPIGKKVLNNWYNKQRNLEVIGVVKDLHYESMHTKIRPMAFFHRESFFSWSPRYISLRLDSNNLSETLSKVENTWNNFNAKLPFEYSFFNTDYNRLYKNEMQTRKLFFAFSSLAVFISCLGLFGLAAFMVENRTREIGIRKVLGASIPGLMVLLNTQFTKWVLFANLIAWPSAWFIMNRWLENFAYKIEIVWWFYLAAAGMAFIIALATVSFQVLRAALANPVEALKYE